jgi:valyl-tRNA synthetase
MENIRDWCISRQIWWGHRIPVFYCDACKHEWAARGVPTECPQCGSMALRQDEDVLDTWFSSWLWPFSTFGWPEANADLKLYYPTHTLVTASEIIFFWVARMIMAGIEFMGDVPFREVVIHGTVRDDSGRKMSKSLGNSIDPLTIVDQYSADALRFSLMMLTATGQDVYVSPEKFEIGRNFGTKLWNAARFMQMHMRDADGTVKPEAARAFAAVVGPDGRLNPAVAFDPAELSPDDRHILAKLHAATASCTENLRRFRFNDAAHDLYEFVWHRYCDWYLECSKDVLYGTDAGRREQVLKVMHTVYATALRLLHPFMPFITDELWHGMNYGAEGTSIMTAPWPEAASPDLLARWGATPDITAYVDEKHELIRTGRMLRADYGIAPGLKIEYVFKPANPERVPLLTGDRPGIETLLKARAFRVEPAFAPPQAMPSEVMTLGTLYMPVEGLIDVAAETAKLAAELERLAADGARVAAKLANAEFVRKAPEQVVAQQRARQQELGERETKVRHLLAMLSPAS